MKVDTLSMYMLYIKQFVLSCILYNSVIYLLNNTPRVLLEHFIVIRVNQKNDETFDTFTTCMFCIAGILSNGYQFAASTIKGYIAYLLHTCERYKMCSCVVYFVPILRIFIFLNGSL